MDPKPSWEASDGKMDDFVIRTTVSKLKGTQIPADFHDYNWCAIRRHLGARRDKPFATQVEFGFAPRAQSAQGGEWRSLR